MAAAPVEAKGIDLKLPEGFEADPKAVEAFKAWAAEQKFDGPTAQKFFEAQLQRDKSARTADDAAIAAQDAKWAGELKADKDFGGTNYEASNNLAQRALDHHFGADAAKLIHAAGLGNHPLLWRGFVRIGKAMAEDTIASTATPAARGLSTEEGLKATYPSMFPPKE